MTKWESEVCELGIKWQDSKFAVEEAFIRQKLIRAINIVKDGTKRREGQSRK